MPIYDYRCRDCGRTTERLHRSFDEAEKPACDHCGGNQTARLISRFATPKSDQQVMDQHGLPDPQAGPDAYKDPRQIGRWAEQRFDEMGVDMPAEARQMIDAARDGELPEPIKDL